MYRSPRRPATSVQQRTRLHVGATNRGHVPTTPQTHSQATVPKLKLHPRQQHLKKQTADKFHLSPRSPRKTFIKKGNEYDTQKAEWALRMLRERARGRSQRVLFDFFQTLDTDDSNYIQREELYDALELLNLKVPPAEADKVFDALDTDKNDKVTMVEFLNGLNRKSDYMQTNEYLSPWVQRFPTTFAVHSIPDPTQPPVGKIDRESRHNLGFEKGLKRSELGPDAQQLAGELYDNDKLRRGLPVDPVKVAELFSKLDYQKKSYISTDALHRHLEEMDTGLPKSSIAEFVSICDPNKDGLIQYPDLKYGIECIRYPRVATVDTFTPRLRPTTTSKAANALTQIGIESLPKPNACTDVFDQMAKLKQESAAIRRPVKKPDSNIFEPLALPRSFTAGNWPVKSSSIYGSGQQDIQFSPRRRIGPKPIAESYTSYMKSKTQS